MRVPSFSPDSLTIYAPASGVGRAAISVVRVSGPASEATLLTLIRGPLPPDRVATLKVLHNPASGGPLDRALVIRFDAPRSFTGESMVEFQITGGRAVLNAVLKALAGMPGLRPAEPGEFAWRAFENGKIDLSQVEGLADLVDAQTDAQRRQALHIAGGALTRRTDEIRTLLMQAMALAEVQIDFSDQEDADAVGLDEVRTLAAEAAELIRRALSTADSGEVLREGFVVVIAGPPNVGKSTLMNVLARRDVSIVTPIPGTTRDPIEVHLDLRGYPVTLVDTAGLRESTDPVEREGVLRARRRAEAADLTLWLTDGPAPAAPPDNERCLMVRTKIDLGGAAFAVQGRPSELCISAKTGTGISDLLNNIAGHVERRLVGDGPALITLERHRLAYQEALTRLEEGLGRECNLVEILAEDLRRAARSLERISGRIDVEEVLGEIFSRLCIGK